MSARTLLTVDLSNQIYRACHAHDALSYDGEFTGGLYGFLMSVSKAIDLTGATDLLVVRDSKPYVRSREYPQYKLLRKTQQDPELKAMYTASEPLISDFLACMGIPEMEAPGFECDDLIAYVVRVARHRRFGRVIAMCSDTDLFPLFEFPGFRMYKNAETGVLKRDWFARSLGLPADVTTEEFIQALAMAGTHNDVEGIPRVGLKTALKLLRGDPLKLRAKRAEYAELIERNLRLIRLPHAALTPQHIPLLAERGRIDHTRTMYRFCARYGISPLPSWAAAFDQVL